MGSHYKGTTEVERLRREAGQRNQKPLGDRAKRGVTTVRPDGFPAQLQLSFGDGTDERRIVLNLVEVDHFGVERRGVYRAENGRELIVGEYLISSLGRLNDP